MSLMIRPTTLEDLKYVQSLWNDGEVMQNVGHPNGLGVTEDKLLQWHEQIQNKETIAHFSIFHAEIGYCGETFYHVDREHDLSSLDIKLVQAARGKGIAHQALGNTLKIIFDQGLCSRAYVDPSLSNTKALKLYDRLGFVAKERPGHLEPGTTYFEITRETFNREGL